MKKQVEEWAESRGLNVGIAPVRPFKKGKAALQWRIERGYSFPFTGGSIEERYQPGLVYPAALSLVVVARPNPDIVSSLRPGEGLLASYALGKDYHVELRSLLEELAGLLKKAGAKFTAIQVDNGPLLEREAAYLAGLGYYGANCSIIIPGIGSNVSLGLVATDLELDPGKPLIPDTCNSCGLCIKACPTGALVKPGLLNPDRCLSYLTQKRGIIPVELRQALDRRIWGCDICQDVCPANREERAKSKINRNNNHALENGPLPLLEKIIYMDSKDFNREFDGTVLAWKGKTVIQRNAAVALGNWKDPVALEPLKHAVTMPSAILRGHAAWALGQLGEKGRSILEEAAERETDYYVLEEIHRALRL